MEITGGSVATRPCKARQRYLRKSGIIYYVINICIKWPLQLCHHFNLFLIKYIITNSPAVTSFSLWAGLYCFIFLPVTVWHIEACGQWWLHLFSYVTGSLKEPNINFAALRALHKMQAIYQIQSCLALLVQCQCLGIPCTYETSSTIIPTPDYRDAAADYLTSCCKYK